MTNVRRIASDESREDGSHFAVAVAVAVVVVIVIAAATAVVDCGIGCYTIIPSEDG